MGPLVGLSGVATRSTGREVLALGGEAEPPEPLFSHPLVRALVFLFLRSSGCGPWFRSTGCDVLAPLRCHQYTGSNALPPMHCLRCTGCDALTAMHGLRCIHCDVLATMYWLPRAASNALAAMYRLRCPGYDDVVAPRHWLRCACCDALGSAMSWLR